MKEYRPEGGNQLTYDSERTSRSAAREPARPAPTRGELARAAVAAFARQREQLQLAIAEVQAAHQANDLPRWTRAGATLTKTLDAIAKAEERAQSFAADADPSSVAQLQATQLQLDGDKELATTLGAAPQGFTPVSREAQIEAALTAPIIGTLKQGHDTKEQQIGSELAQLSVKESYVLAQRLLREDPPAGDRLGELFKQYKRISPERHLRLLAFVKDARRREVIDASRAAREGRFAAVPVAPATQSSTTAAHAEQHEPMADIPMAGVEAPSASATAAPAAPPLDQARSEAARVTSSVEPSSSNPAASAAPEDAADSNRDALGPRLAAAAGARYLGTGWFKLARSGTLVEIRRTHHGSVRVTRSDDSLVLELPQGVAAHEFERTLTGELLRLDAAAPGDRAQASDAYASAADDVSSLQRCPRATGDTTAADTTGAADIALEARWHAAAAPIARQLSIEVPVIHANADARERVEAAGGRGVALGRVIYLHPDKIAPNSEEGREVLTHELVHLAQADLDGDAPRVDAEEEADEIATSSDVRPPAQSIDLREAAADKDAKPRKHSEAPQLGDSEPFRWIPSSYSLWVKGPWFRAAPDFSKQGNQWRSPSRIGELLRHLKGTGIMAWATTSAIERAASTVGVEPLTEPVSRVNIGVSSFWALGLPPGTSALVDREDGGLDVVVAADNLPPGTEIKPSPALLKQMVDALTGFTKLPFTDAGKRAMATWDGTLRVGTASISYWFSPKQCHALFGEAPYESWYRAPAQDGPAVWVPGGVAQSFGDLTELEYEQVRDWLKANLKAGEGAGQAVQMSKQLLALIKKVDGPPPHLERDRILKMLKGGDGKGDGQAVSAYLLERIIGEAEFEAARISAGFKETEYKPDVRPPVFNSPLPFKIDQRNDKIIDGENVEFLINIDWPKAELIGDQDTLSDYRWRTFAATCDWHFERTLPNGTKKIERETITTHGGSKGLSHRFKLEPGEESAIWTVQVFARHSHFLPNTDSTQVEVKTEAKRLTEGRDEAFGGMGTFGVDDAGHDFSTSTYNEWFGDHEYDHGKRFRGELPAGFTAQTAEARTRTLAAEITRQEALVEYLRKNSQHPDAVTAAERYLAKLRDAKESIGDDVEAGWAPFDVRGTFLGRGNRFADGPLDLYGAVKRTKILEREHVTVQIRDLSRRFEAENYRFQGYGDTFEQALEAAFVDLCKNYPAGTVSILAEGFDTAGTNRTEKTVGFELDTGTEWEDTKSVVFDPIVQAVVNIGSALVMIFLPFTAPVLLPLTIAYNEVQNVDAMVHAWENGTLTAGKAALSLAQIGLDLIPLASRAKIVTSSTKTFALLEGFDIAGQAIVMTLEARNQIRALESTYVAQMAVTYEKYVQLEKSTHGSDPRVAEMKAKLDKEAEKIRGATLEVVGGLIKDQLISYVPIKAATHIQHHRQQRRMADLEGSGLWRIDDSVDAPYYDKERGRIVGKRDAMDDATADRLLTEQDAHLRAVGTKLGEDLEIPAKGMELRQGDENLLWFDGKIVQVRYKPGTNVETAVAKWKRDAAAAKIGTPPDPHAPPKPDDPRTPSPDRSHASPHSRDHVDDSPRARKPDRDSAPPDRAPARRVDQAPAPELIEHGDRDAKATTAAAVPGSDFKSKHDAAGDPEAVKAAAQRRMIAATDHVAEIRRIERATEPDTYLVTFRKGSPISVRVVAGALEGDVVARTIVNPTKTGPTRVERIGKDDKIRLEKVRVKGRYVIQVSDRVDPVHAERALAHELTEIAVERQLAKSGDAAGPDVLRPGEIDTHAQLSPHDRGRVTEINVLAAAIDAKRVDAAERRELMALVEHLGLRDGIDGAAARRALIEEHLSASAKQQLDRLREPEADLPPEAKADLDAVRMHGEQDAKHAEDHADYKAPLHDVPDAAAPGVKVTRERAAELAKEAAIARATKSAETVAYFRAVARGLPDGQYPKVESPQLGAGASLAARDPSRLLIDARGRWQADASSDIAQTASQLRGIKEAGLGDPFEFAGPNERVPMSAVRYWEDTIATQGMVIDARARLELVDDGRVIVVIDKPGDGGPPIKLEVTGTPMVSSGFVPERIPGQKMPADAAIRNVKDALTAIARDSDPAKGERREKAQQALAELESLSGIANEKGAREGDLAKALEILSTHGLDAEVQSKAKNAHDTLKAGDAFKKLRDEHPDKMFFGDEANLDTLDAMATDRWVIAGTGGTGVSAAEIILAKNPKAHVTMAGRDIPPGLLENEQFQALLKAHADPQTVQAINRERGLRIKPGDGRFTVMTGVDIGTPVHKDGEFQVGGKTRDDHGTERDPVRGEGYVAAIGRDNQLPPFVAALVYQTEAAGGRAEMHLLWDKHRQYIGYQVTLIDQKGATLKSIDVTGAASRFPPWERHRLATESSETGRTALAEEKEAFRRASDLDAPPESGNFDGGFASSAAQAARYGRDRRAVEEAAGASRPRSGVGSGGAAGSRTETQMRSLEQSLPPELRGEVPIIENDGIEGTGVRVVYDAGDLRIEVGRDAEARHVRAHAEIARTLLGYRGPIGLLRRLLDAIKTKLRLTPGYGTTGFEARLEVQKLEAIRVELEALAKQVNARVDEVSKSNLANIDERKLASELASIDEQLEHHRSVVDSYEPGRGFVAADATKEIRVRAADLSATPHETSKEWTMQFDAREADGRSIYLGQASVLLDEDGNPLSGPSLTIDAHETRNGEEHAMHAYDESGTRVPLTAYALDHAIAGFKDRFHAEPTTLPGRLMDSNLLNFQREFIKATRKGLSNDDAKIAAIRSISFGRHRIARGYDRFDVTMKDFKDADLGTDPRTGVRLGIHPVPHTVETTATRSVAEPVPGENP